MKKKTYMQVLTLLFERIHPKRPQIKYFQAINSRALPFTLSAEPVKIDSP